MQEGRSTDPDLSDFDAHTLLSCYPSPLSPRGAKKSLMELLKVQDTGKRRGTKQKQTNKKKEDEKERREDTENQRM